MRILDDDEIKADMREIRRREQTLLLEKRRNENTVLLKLTFGTFYVLMLLVAVKIAVMLWNDPTLITSLEQHYRLEAGWSPIHTMRLEFHVVQDLLKMALTSLF